MSERSRGMGFRMKISPEIRARIDDEAREVRRLYGLPDRFLARALMELAEQARRDAPDRFSDPEICGYENMVVRALVPRLARSLGETQMSAEAVSLLPVVPEGGAELRMFTGNCLDNQMLDRLGQELDSRAMRLLGRSFVNGNPVTIALDRVAPPQPGAKDWVTRHMQEVSRARHGHSGHVSWSPEFQEYQRAEPVLTGDDLIGDGCPSP